MRTRRRFHYALLAAIWLFPSAGAVFIIIRDIGSWQTSAGVQNFLSSVRIEDWTAILLLLAQIFFLVQAIRYARLCRRSGPVEKHAASEHS
jgi:hypothetical protein